MSKQDTLGDMNRQDFVETNGSLSRVNTVLDGIRSGNPLLLEGETGSSKTRTAIEASLRNGQTPIVLNFSSQTTFEDLIGRITKDSNSYGYFSFTNGPYTEAFINGDCIILDEINLAYENVLQCIQASLDSGKLYLEMSGSEQKFVVKHPNFHVIATQNPLKGRFSQKRQSFSQKFRSLFQIITFDEIKYDELKEIADGLAKDLIIGNKEEIIEKLIKFHFFWKEKATKENQIHVFTIREIKRTIESMKKGLSFYESILINYGSRYDQTILFEMQKILLSHEFGFVHEDSQLKVPFYDEKLFFMTKPIQRALSSSFHMLQTCQPILITGSDGCGKTSFARWIAQIYQQQQEITVEKNNDEEKDNYEHNKNNESKKQGKMTNFFICNPEVSISDIIGRYMPIKRSDGEAPIMWIDGPVVKSVKNGHCLILDQIDTAPSTILERLNSLFDNLGIENAKFQVQENSEESSVPIHQNFRIIATSTIDGLNDISPALLNRFTIIHIDDQFKELIKNNQINEFIKQIAPQFVQTKDINLISKAIIRDKNRMTVSKISMIVNGFSSLKKTFPRAISSQVLDFCLYATSNNMNIPQMDENFINLLLSSLNEDDNKDKAYDTFIYNNAEAIKRIMAVLVAAFVAGFHIVLIGKTGLGKTSAAIALSKLSKFSKGRKFISFNGQTQQEELFGFFTIEKGNFTSHLGPLSDAMENGRIFIADELNLADQMIIQSLNVAIEPSRNEEIILPVIGKNITIDKQFFFIGCQNDISMYGRKQLPEVFKKKVLCINYPDNSYSDLLNISSTLAKQFELPINCALGTTELIKLMKEDPIFKKKVWSLREVRKLF